MSGERASDSWEHGSAYERYVGRWSRQVAPLFLAWIDAPPNARWLDVGCGTGALSAAIIDQCAPASVHGIDPSEGFLTTARLRLGDQAVLSRASAETLPLPDASVDAVVSGLVLNFVPDHHAALTEMVRVATKGATIGAYVWDYGGKMQFMRHFWDAASELYPSAANLDESRRFPLCQPDALLAAFTKAGIVRPEVRAIDIPTPFADFDDYWQPFLGGQGPAPAYVVSLDDRARQRLRDKLRATLPTQAGGSISLIARALAVRGVTAGLG